MTDSDQSKIAALESKVDHLRSELIFARSALYNSFEPDNQSEAYKRVSAAINDPSLADYASAQDDADRFDALQEILQAGGSVWFDGVKLEWVLEHGNISSRCAGGLSVLIDDYMDRHS